MTSKAIFSFLILLALLAPGEAIAHKASVFAYAEAGLVRAEGFYFDGSPCKGCAIRVLTSQPGDEGEGDKILSKGKTDEQGVFTFNDQAGIRPLLLRMDAGEGHLATFTLETEPVAALEGDIEPFNINGEAVFLPEYEQECGMDMEAIVEDLVEARIQKRLAPLRAEISRLRRASERPGITEVIGGIGYIIGLAGIWLYFRSKKEKKD